MEEQRLRLVPIAVDMLATVCKQGTHVYDVCCVDGLPAEATLRRWYLDRDQQDLVFVFEHWSFDPVPDGGRIPAFHPIYRGSKREG